MFRINTLLLFFALFFSSYLFAQKYVKMMADESVNFYDVQREATKFFEKTGTGKGSGYKQYKRWEYETELLIDSAGNRMSEQQMLSEIKKFKQDKYLKMGVFIPPASDENTAFYPASASTVWEEVGPKRISVTSSWNPGNGRITAIAVDPDNTNLIFAGTPEGGIWKSTDGGNSWSTVTDQMPNLKIYSIAIHPTNKNIIYAGTNGGGIYSSTDQGESWTQNTTPAGKIYKILIDPTNPTIIMIATSTGIYRSTNDGSTWVKVYTASVEDIEFKPDNSSIVYAIGDYYHRSTNNGSSWSAMTSTGFTGGDRSLLAVTAANPNVVYIVLSSGSIYSSFWRSTDAGITFTMMHSGTSGNQNLFGYEPDGSGTTGQASYDMAMCASATDANEVHIGGIICWKTTNGGISWTATTDWTWNNSIGYNHADVHVLEYIGNTIYSGTDGGIYSSNNQGGDWIDLSAGIGNRMFYRFGLCKSDPSYISGGAQDNGTTCLRTGSWYDWIGADGMESFIDHTNNLKLFGTAQNGSLYKSTNGGTSYSSIAKPSGESGGNWVTPFCMDPQVSTTLYVGYVKVYKSTLSGLSWTAISNYSTTSKCNILEVAPSNSNYIYTRHGTDHYMTSNGGTSWSTIVKPGTGTVNTIAIHPKNPSTILYGCSNGKVYKSIDGGSTFIDISDNLPAIAINKIVWDDKATEGIYVGMSKGVYYIDNSLSSWQNYTENLPYVSVYDMEWHAATKRIYVATHGRGAWWANAFTTNAVPEVSLTNPADSSVYQLGQSINISAVASDIDGTISKVEFYDGAVKLGIDTTSPYSYTWTNATVGSHSLTAVATDNLGEPYVSPIVTITVQSSSNQLPTIVITNPMHNRQYLIGDTAVVTIDAADSDGSIAAVEIYANNALLTTLTESPYTYHWSSLQQGRYTLFAVAIDQLAARQNSDTITIIVDNRLPSVMINSPSDLDVFYSGTPLTIDVSAYDDDGSINHVDIYVDSVLMAGALFETPYSITLTQLPKGEHNIFAVAFDNDGASSISSTISITILNQTPIVNLVSPGDNSTFLVGDTIRLEAIASDLDGSLVNVDFYADSIWLGNDTSAPFLYNWPTLAQGSYLISARATDNEGAVSSDTIVVNIDMTTILDELIMDEFTVYPNPSEGTLYIKSKTDTPYHVIIHNYLGDEVFHQACKSRQTVIHLNHQIANGFYTMHIQHMSASVTYKLQLIR